MAATMMKAIVSPVSSSSSVQKRPSLRALRAAPGPQMARQSYRVACTMNTPLPVKVAENIGLPTQEGLFGFKPFAELWVGRLAMMGFLTGLVEEYATGRGILAQIGFTTPDTNLLTVILALTSAATLIGTARTISRATSGKLSPLDAARYRRFFGLENEAKNVADESKARKASGDFTSPDKLDAIAVAKASGTPAEAFLSQTDLSAVDQAKAAGTPADAILSLEDTPASPAAPAMTREEYSNAVTWRYAKGVEITNGRWAMLGFWASIAAEAYTGHGTIGQGFDFFKATGFLGPMSGF